MEGYHLLTISYLLVTMAGKLRTAVSGQEVEEVWRSGGLTFTVLTSDFSVFEFHVLIWGTYLVYDMITSSLHLAYEA